MIVVSCFFALGLTPTMHINNFLQPSIGNLLDGCMVQSLLLIRQKKMPLCILKYALNQHLSLKNRNFIKFQTLRSLFVSQKLKINSIHINHFRTKKYFNRLGASSLIWKALTLTCKAFSSISKRQGAWNSVQFG